MKCEHCGRNIDFKNTLEEEEKLREELEKNNVILICEQCSQRMEQKAEDDLKFLKSIIFNE